MACDLRPASHRIMKGYKMSFYNKKTRRTLVVIVCVVIVLAMVAPLVIAITNL